MTNTADRTDRAAHASAFGAALADQLKRRGLWQRDVAQEIGVSPAYISKLRNGTKLASPRWADLIADVLGSTPQEREALHRAAATDAGYKLDLTK